MLDSPLIAGHRYYWLFRLASEPAGIRSWARLRRSVISTRRLQSIRSKTLVVPRLALSSRLTMTGLVMPVSSKPSAARWSRTASLRRPKDRGLIFCHDRRRGVVTGWSRLRQFV